MGKIIETPYIAHSELTNEIYIINKNNKYCVTDQVIKAVESTNRAIPKSDYENRLKADLEAILVELQLEIEELDTPNNSDAYIICADIVQQKINALKGDQEGEE